MLLSMVVTGKKLLDNFEISVVFCKLGASAAATRAMATINDKTYLPLLTILRAYLVRFLRYWSTNMQPRCNPSLHQKLPKFCILQWT